MKKLNLCALTIVLLFLRTFVVFGQSDHYNFKYQLEHTLTHTYEPSAEFETKHIVSDYGKRNVPIKPSRWHRGVDFKIGSPTYQWDHFLSPLPQVCNLW